MSLLERLLKKLQRTEEKQEGADLVLKDMLFDWFNDHNDNLKAFINNFLEPCLGVYAKDERTKKYFDNFPDKIFDQYFNQHAILYLAAKYPDNRRFKALLDYLLNQENQVYTLKESIRNIPSEYQFNPDAIHLWNILKTGNTILKIYHAFYDNRDQNISYISDLPRYIMGLTMDGKEQVFSEVMDYFNKQPFEGKLCLLSNAIPTVGMTGYNINSVNTLHKEKRQALDLYNKVNLIQISEPLTRGFDNSFFNIPYTKIFSDCEQKKRKFLKLDQFPETIQFLADNADSKPALIKYYLIKTGLTYLSRDLLKLYKDLFPRLIKGLRINSPIFLSFVNTKIESNNHALIYNHLLAPMLKDPAIIADVTDTTVDQFESLFLKDIIEYRDLTEFQPTFDAILSRRNQAMDKLALSLKMAKYNQLYASVSFSYSWISLDINSKKRGDFVINSILDRLNFFFPSSLKSLAKQIQYVFNGSKLCTLNIEGVDYDFTDNIIRELNLILKTKKTGYRFLPILIQKAENYPISHTDKNIFKCSIELLNYQQYQFYKQMVENDSDLPDAYFLQDYDNQETPILDHHEKNKTESKDEISFPNDPTWKWFKDDYVDKLESSTKWYAIMDLLKNCKGTAKPSKQWTKEISEAIMIFGKERYFKELGSLISNSLKESFWFLDNYRTTIKGIIWSCALHPNTDSLSIIQSIVETSYTKIRGVGPKSAVLGNLGLNAFVLSKSDEAFGILNLIRNKSKYQRFINAIDKSIDKYLADVPGDAEELADKTIPDFGFIDDQKTIQVAEQISALFLINNNKLTKKWTVAGKTQTTIPTLIKQKYKAHEKEIAAEFKRINVAYKQLKDRIKTYWLYNRTWKYEIWQKHIFNHALLNSYLKNMIWSNETTRQTFLCKDGIFVDANNNKVNFDADNIISLWHPVTADNSEINDWQQYIFNHKIDQPLRQAFREHYPFSDTESKKQDSNRFAHHFLVVRKLMAIANSAGWIFTYEHEGQSWPRKFIKPLNITVHLKCDYSTTDYAIPTKELYITDKNTVKINTRNEIIKKSFSEIPSKTLSEVCRDMDLFIATTSIANDPELSLKTEQQEFYRQDFNRSYFSDNASARIRKQAINVLAPSIGILPIFEKNYLVVQGKLNIYRINLGSGFAQLASSQKHINLLPDIQPIKKSKKVHAPIQDDETLYIILAKAKFLMNDDQITDPKFTKAVTT